MEEIKEIKEVNIKAKRGRKSLLIFSALILLLIFLAKPGIFVIQPIGAIPEGITIVYHSRNPAMSFISSPDGMCLQNNLAVTLLCRVIALNAASELSDRIVLRLPYNHWAYLISTGGREFGR